VDPVQFPVGIEHVLINGHAVMKSGEYKRHLAGKVLRMNAAS
jgi:N-acyl-D-amino-acid deacylase